MVNEEQVSMSTTEETARCIHNVPVHSHCDDCVIDAENTEHLYRAPAPKPGQDAGEWTHGINRCYVYDASGEGVAVAYKEEGAEQIIADHRSAAAVPKLVQALKARVSPTRCYCSAIGGAKCADCADRELLARVDTADHPQSVTILKLTEALQIILYEAEFVGDAKAPFSTWVAERCRKALATVDQTGEDDGKS